MTKITTTKPLQTTVTSFSHDGRGIAHINGKTTFISGALPGEHIEYSYLRRRSKFDEAETTNIITASPTRATPPCPHFSQCGGCSLQHITPTDQITFKQAMLLEQLQHVGGVKPEIVLPPLTAATVGYRRKARLGVRFVRKKQSVLVGFREKNGRYLTDIHSCAILDPRIGQRITELRQLIAQMQAFDHIPQIEVAAGDDICALVFRHMIPLEPGDVTLLANFGRQHQLHIYLQPNNVDSIHRIWPSEGPAELSYKLPDQQLELRFQPSDFTQVNADINRQLVTLAVSLLDPQSSERILDLFCGLGNFTLALAQRSLHVTGVEGDSVMVKRAQDNAQHNHIQNVAFFAHDLTSDFAQTSWGKEPFDKLLIDPPRSGAVEVIPHLPRLGIKRIVYVSCNPATLARDAKELASQKFQLKQAGIMDMFPHTSHVESIAVFERVG